MDSVFQFSFLFAASVLMLLVLVNVINIIQGKGIKLFGFKFSNKAFYIAHSVLIIPYLIKYFIFKSNEINLFLFFGIAGILGEMFFSLLWDSLFAKKFWTYKVHTIFHGYSSWLNFLPWGMGGMLFVYIYQLLDFQYQNPIIKTELSIHPIYVLWFVSGLCWILVYIRQLVDKNKKSMEFRRVTLSSYAWFSLPILFPVFILGIFFAVDYIYLSIALGLIAFVAEYSYGKLCELSISKKLWTYTYFTFDNGHGTLLAIIPFILAGWYFLSFYLLLF